MKFEKRERIETDVLIIGGGTAGCYAALTLQKESNAKVLIVEKRPFDAAAVWRPA